MVIIARLIEKASHIRLVYAVKLKPQVLIIVIGTVSGVIPDTSEDKSKKYVQSNNEIVLG